ncbi:hypothetical protein TsFJ059_008273 [Trichoderma semiorbis]|uniref:Uncharacterized protein n=1 Tax=Trichoderma semiorbis TaxID=1491008 RepID=A0A9P8KNZ9_9HYPO|nr:hypothetical protein TsFJ059_008273 [Trichoderma semiorbis]
MMPRSERNSETVRSNGEDDDVADVSDIIKINERDVVRNYAGIMFECQQFYSGFVRPETPPPPPGIQVTTRVTITRAQAIEKLEPYLTRARQEKFQASVNDELAKRMSEEIVQVMDAETKTWLRTWAIFVDKPDILKWVDDAKDDMETVEYTETRTLPGRAMWSNDPADTIIQDLLDCASAPGVPDAVRHLNRAATYAINHYVKAMEKKHRTWANAEAMNNLDAVMNTIRDEGSKTRDLIMNKLDALMNTIKDEGNKTRELIKSGKRTHEEAFQKEESDL